jgi:putative inorganic carbon (HCO3(-)) transporter
VGFALTVLYIVVTIISPDQFGPEWAGYRPLLFIALITFLVSLRGIFCNEHLRSSIQTYLLIAFIVAIGLSEVANGWIGGVVASWQVFLPSAAVFFFIVANVTSIFRLKILTLATVASCLIVVVEALCGYYAGFHSDMFVLHQNLYSNDEIVGQFSRLRGAGFLNDPNDFAQILLISLSLIFIAWERRQGIANLLIVFVPAALFLWAIYLTHSRGALIGLAVLALMTARKSIGNKASVILVTALVLGMLALDFTGGRGISAVEGADRLEAWANGLELFKSAPLFGVGFGGFTDFSDITAHNSFVLCLAELGLVGSTLWVALLVTTMTSLSRIIRQHEKGKLEQTLEGNMGGAEYSVVWLVGGLPLFREVVPYSDESPTKTAIAAAPGVEARVEPAHQPIVPKHWVVVLRLALVSFITTGWFLSRSYNTTVYLVLGLATATIALQGNVDELHIQSRWVSFTLAVEALAIIFVYGIVRLRQ